MKYDPDKHQRRSIRLPGYDYSQSGAYFVTICAYQRQCLFGEIIDGRMVLNQYGAIVADEWQKSSIIRQEIELDGWVVMPNHFHGIVIIQNPVGKNRDRIVRANGNGNVRANGNGNVRANGNGDVRANDNGDVRANDNGDVRANGDALANPLGRSPLQDNAPVQMKPKSLSSLMAGFKSITTKKINILRDAPATPLWQRNYYEHIIRDRDAMDKIRQYIVNNPVSWERDQLHPDHPSKW